MPISLTICNLALGELRAAPITDIDEGSVESSNCKIFYPQCLELLLERHDWSFATKIASLAALTTNERASEWLYAYGLPADMAIPKRLVPPADLGALTSPSTFPPYAIVGQPYIVEAGVLYTQVPGAILEYSVNDLDEAFMPAHFADALAYSLASRMAVPIRDSRELKGQLLQQYEAAAQRAIAHDQNRQQQRDASYTDEVTIARTGPGYYGLC